ncbi:hypothetical protein OC844_006928 [Tilletia horrida]|nr:hypothetical protein OC844_006928 [Tilletia horrida]
MSNPFIVQRGGLSLSASGAASSSAGGSSGGGGGAGASGGGGGGTNLSIHPLPILNMSEHHTRFRSQAGHDDVQVYGILLGTQQGRDVELHNSFEIVVSAADGQKQKKSGSADAAGAGAESSAAAGPTVDHHLLKSRQDLFKQVFPAYDIMGWYSSGPEPTEHDMAIHKQASVVAIEFSCFTTDPHSSGTALPQLLAYNETLLFFKLSPSHLQQSDKTSAKRGDDDLPLYAYETVLEVAGRSAASGTATTSGERAQGQDAEGEDDAAEESMHVLWAPCSYRIETGEAERIAVDHASKPPQTGTGEETTLIANLTTQYNAIKMLSDRVRAVSQYVALVQSGAFPRDHETLRQIRALVSCLPVVGMPELKDEIIEEYNDVLLTSYLSSLTHQVTNLNELVDKFDVTQEPISSASAGNAIFAGLASRRMPRLAPSSLTGAGGGGGGGAGPTASSGGAGPSGSGSGGAMGPGGAGPSLGSSTLSY